MGNYWFQSREIEAPRCLEQKRARRERIEEWNLVHERWQHGRARTEDCEMCKWMGSIRQSLVAFAVDVFAKEVDARVVKQATIHW